MPELLQELFRGRGEKRAADVERQVRSSSPVNPGSGRQPADPYAAGSSLRTDLATAQSGALKFGRITEAVAYTHCYRVQLGRGDVIIPCSDLGHTSFCPVGARQVNTYSPGTLVLVFHPKGLDHGIIIGAIPDFGVDARSALSDAVFYGSNAGLNTDLVHKFPFLLPGNGGLSDWSGGRPFDSLPAGEWGAMTDTGLGVFLDSFMAFVRVNEETGLYLFLEDQLTRLSGHNLQVRSAGYNREDVDDQGEFSSVEGWTAYLWEARGALDRFTQPFRALSDQETQQDTPYYGKYEPVWDDQQSFYRTQEFKGYLGQGGKRMVLLPPYNGLFRDNDLAQVRALAEENWSYDGFIGVRSAKGIILAKRTLIPAPKRIRQPDNPAGDTEANYSFNGVDGGGPYHLVQDFLRPPEPAAQTRASAIQDIMAHAFNWKGAHPFYYHQYDWYLPDEATYEDRGSWVPAFDALMTSTDLEPPEPLSWWVDERHESTLYFPNDSFIAMLDDGGIVISDGWATEIRMGGGNGYLDAPGNWWVRTGKSFVVYSGWDCVLNANNCADISANWGDVRIGARRHVLVLGGYGGCGGVLLESRGEGVAYQVDPVTQDPTFTGILLRAPKSGVASVCDKFLVGPASGSDTAEISLDAGNAGTLSTRAKRANRFFPDDGYGIDMFGDSVNEYSGDGATFSTGLAVSGDLLVDGCAQISTNLVALDHVAASHFALPTQDAINLVNDNLSQLTTRAETLSDYAADVLDIDYIATHSNLKTVAFLFRSASDYGTSAIQLFEARWQKLWRLAVADNTNITKSRDPNLQNPPVTPPAGQKVVNYWHLNALSGGPGGYTAPHPGYDSWYGTSFYSQDLQYFDPVDGVNVNRGPAYERPTFTAPVGGSFEGRYLIINNPVPR